MGPALRRTLILLGSARGDGHTARAAEHLRRGLGPSARLIDLQSSVVGAFDYGRTDDRDGFRTIVGAMLAHDGVVFATPVYWYAMSGVMKNFFDRLTDLLLDEHARPLGRALAGRNVWLLATGAGATLPPGFAEPFAQTARYFEMRWQRSLYLGSRDGAPRDLADFAAVDRLAAEVGG